MWNVFYPGPAELAAVLGFGLWYVTPHADKMVLVRRLTGAGALDAVFADFMECGYLVTGGQIVYAALLIAPKTAQHRAWEGGLKAGSAHDSGTVPDRIA